MAFSEVAQNLVPWSSDTTKQSPAFKLFHYTYQCYVPGIHLVSVEEFHEFGYVTTGDSAADRALIHEERLVLLTPARMADLYADGASIRLVNYVDAATIYDHIYLHLQDWRNEIDNNIMRRQAPMDDLKKFDNMARELFQYARHHVTYNPATSKFFAATQSLAAARGLGAINEIINRGRGHAPAPELQHVNYVDHMTRALTERQRSFRN